MEWTFLYIYVGLILTVFVIFKLIDRQSNPFKKISFWVTQLVSLVILTIGLTFLVLYAIGGPSPKDGLHQEFYLNGKLESEFFIKDGKIEGLSRSWYSNGQLQYYSKYKDGQHIDTSITYLENGQIKFFELVKDGKSRKSISYYDNGQVQSEQYNPGKSTGINYRKDYYENGKLKLEIIVSNSTFNGEGIYYDNKGNVEYKGNYQDGQKDGIWYKFNTSTGHIIDQDTFHFNRPRSFKETWKYN
jgi:antitoxin component YwqK of YwqJK toxin-antitoxin module